MKILIVSRYFAPDNTVGAIRWTKFAKYLTRLGHDVTVYAMEPWTKIRDPILERDAKELPRVFRIGHGRLYRAMHDFFARRDPTAGTGSAEIRQAMRADGAGAASGNAPRKVGALTEKLLSIAYHVMQLWMERDFVRTYRRYTKEDTETYDAVIGTWSTDSSLLVALDMKKRGRAKKFVADFRDSCVSSWPELTKNRDVRRMLKRVYEEADLVMAVGEKVLEANRAFAPAARKTAVLTNGYDPEDLAGIGPQPDDGRFHIVYTGQIYPGLQDFTDLFAALRSLIARGVLPKDGVRLDYLGQSYAVLREQAAACGMEGSAWSTVSCVGAPSSGRAKACGCPIRCRVLHTGQVTLPFSRSVSSRRLAFARSVALSSTTASCPAARRSPLSEARTCFCSSHGTPTLSPPFPPSFWNTC